MSDIKKRPVAYGGNVSGHATITIEIGFGYDLEDLCWLDFYGEVGDTEEDLLDQINADIERSIESEVTREMENLGYRSGEPEVIVATNFNMLDYKISEIDIEMEDVYEDADKDA
jgi:hypothetical protein